MQQTNSDAVQRQPHPVGEATMAKGGGSREMPPFLPAGHVGRAGLGADGTVWDTCGLLPHACLGVGEGLPGHRNSCAEGEGVVAFMPLSVDSHIRWLPSIGMLPLNFVPREVPSGFSTYVSNPVPPATIK